MHPPPPFEWRKRGGAEAHLMAKPNEREDLCLPGKAPAIPDDRGGGDYA